MSKHFKPGAKSVAIHPSRIRREPVRVKTPAEIQAEEDAAREREKWRTFGGLAFFAAGIAALAIAVGTFTYSHYDPEKAAAEAGRFRQCYAGPTGNCVLDGDTVRVAGKLSATSRWVDIAGLEAPRIDHAACGDEKTGGIAAAVRLENLLNSGKVTVGDSFLDEYGRTVSAVEVDGKDVAKAMIAAGVARAAIPDKRDWCAIADEGRQDSE